MSSIDTVNPFTGKVEYSQPLHTDAQVDATLGAAAQAFPHWAALPSSARGDFLRKAAAELRKRKDDIQQIMSAEMGKLKQEALGEIEKCAGACEWYADNGARFLADEAIPTEARSSYVHYEPIGTVFAVMPWNFPIWQVFRFLAPTFMAGNAAVLKHAVNVPRCADAIKAVLDAAGLPAGVFAVLHIDNDQAADVIRDPRIAAVTLTGSERAGKSIASTAGGVLKKCVLELGGSDAFVVLDDADLGIAIPAAVSSRFGNAGQTCIAAKRFIVTPKIANEFVARFVEAASKLQVGNPNDEATTLAPMARKDLRDELDKQVKGSIAAGAKVLIGGESDGTYAGYKATIIDHVAPGQPAYSQELFGPVASILRAQDEADALRIANDTSFGLGGSVWTGELAKGETFARQLQCGAAFVNAAVRSDARLPFGGSKRSGYGRELAEHGIREFTNIKTVYVA